MSMSLLTLVQFLQTLVAYLFVTLALPCAVLSKKLSQYRFMDRVLFYFIIGNFYAANLVFLLQLLHISNFFTLWIGMLVVPAIIWVRMDQFPLSDKLRSFGHSVRKLLTGSLSIRSAVDSLWRNILGRCTKSLRNAGANFRRNWLDWLLVVALILMLIWVYGTRMLQSFGYTVPDIPVHMYWVNAMNENNIYTDGVYPFAMHAVIYLINKMFGIDTYVMFRVFALVQCLAAHVMALLFLKCCCKSRYAAYVSVFLYVISNYIASFPLQRYLATLPQEMSIIFILPTAYYALRFFKEKKRELEEELPKTSSRMALVGLIMSFSLCFVSHSYGAIIAALFCIGIAVGHIRLLIRPVYFKRIIAAALVSVTIAILPMWVAFATGTRLNWSYAWGADVIANISQQEEQQTPDVTTQPENTQDVTDPDFSATKVSPLEAVMRFPFKLWSATGVKLKDYISIDAPEWYNVALRVMIIFLNVAGIALLLRREQMYGAMLLSTGVCMLLMSMQFSAHELGIPALMDADRTSEFYAYLLVVVIGFTVDICVCMLTCLSKNQRFRDILSFAVVIAFGFSIWWQNMIRSPLVSDGLETDEAVTCLTNIIATEPDYSWTIVSANDETQMVYGHGYHYETIELLQKIDKLSEETLTMPTDTIYFFIEKIPLDYYVHYWGSGQTVSQEGAQKALPSVAQLKQYQGENRWIVMSHIYYWAQEFQRLYPNEMKVYLETDEFVCYRLEQNPYRLYDLAIDYGYNSAESEER